ncbi:MAG: Ig-like domain-containing protein [Bacteroidota bacterium]
MKNKNIFKIITGAVIMAMVIFAGCQKMEIVKIVGFIQGHAFDGNTNAPLDSVKVVWSVAGVKDSTVATAEDGYLIRNLPEGEYSIWASKTNYTTVVYDKYIGGDGASTTTTVRGGANQEQIITYNPNLYPLNVSITGRVYISENGVNVPASGAIVQLDYNSLYEEAEESYRFIPGLYEVVTDANGYYTFANIPATDAYIRFLDYTDANGETYYDGSYSHSTSSRRIYINSGSTYTYDNIILSKVNDNFHLISSNTWTSTNIETEVFDVTSDITLTFNKDVDQAATEALGNVTLDDNEGNEINATVTYSGNTIAINPTSDLQAGAWYNIDFEVYSVIPGDNTSDDWDFKTLGIPAPVPTAVTDLTLAESYPTDKTFDAHNVKFKFDFTSVMDGEVRYEIWAKDTYNNLNWVLVDDNFYSQNDDDIAEKVYDRWVYLQDDGREFDYFEDDGWQTPMEFGTEVTFKIRAVNKDNIAGPWSNEITISDETPYDNSSMNLYEPGWGTANNSLGTEPITFRVSLEVWGETNWGNAVSYVDLASTPTFGIYDGTGTEITGATFSFEWTDRDEGMVTVTVPAGANYQYQYLRAYNVTDSSGNIMDAADYESELLNN